MHRPRLCGHARAAHARGSTRIQAHARVRAGVHAFAAACSARVSHHLLLEPLLLLVGLRASKQQPVLSTQA
eukprot:2485502-Pleurochrysis_carterae.AAC.1